MVIGGVTTIPLLWLSILGIILINSHGYLFVGFLWLESISCLGSILRVPQSNRFCLLCPFLTTNKLHAQALISLSLLWTTSGTVPAARQDTLRKTLREGASTHPTPNPCPRAPYPQAAVSEISYLCYGCGARAIQTTEIRTAAPSYPL